MREQGKRLQTLSVDAATELEPCIGVEISQPFVLLAHRHRVRRTAWVVHQCTAEERRMAQLKDGLAAELSMLRGQRVSAAGLALDLLVIVVATAESLQRLVSPT
jgi:hypothetical protein